jgi:dTDP-4-dehydrorhamnose reductase
MKEKILIFGNGQIGNFYRQYFDEIGWEAEIAKGVDITGKEQVGTAVEDLSPSVVINAAAKTNLEWCQENKLEAFEVNVLGADKIAQVCDEQGVKLVHLSSGCIFESKTADDAKSEDSEPNPLSYYSWTKVWAENLIKWNKSPDFKYLILRPRQPVSARVNHKNMLVKMLTFTKFVDTPNSGTVLEDLMEWTRSLLESQASGIYHVANPGWTTPYKIGLLLKKYINPAMDIEQISKDELDKLTPSTRVDTVLDVDKLRSLGIEPTTYEERLEEVIQKLSQNIKTMDKDKLKQELEKTAEQSRERTVVNDVWQKLLD